MGITDTLSSLMHKIPGYTGLVERAERRETDARHREFIAKKLTSIKSDMQSIQEEFLSSGNLSVMEPFDKVSNKLDRVIERTRHASRGYSGFFDAVKVDVEELGRIYEHDLNLVNLVASVEEGLTAIEASADGGGDPKAALRALTKTVESIDKALDEREAILKGIR
ncbi:hypothetical protein IJT93_13165 [bacterium]|nr:hypothetical protein [bacterium]